MKPIGMTVIARSRQEAPINASFSGAPLNENLRKIDARRNQTRMTVT